MSDVEQLKTNWCCFTIGDVVEIHDNERKPINNSERQTRIENKNMTALFPYYGATGQVGWIDDYLSYEESVLVGEDAAPFLHPHKNKAYIIKGRFWVNNHAHILRGLKELVSNKFILHQMNYVDYQPHVSGSTRLKLTKTALKNMPFLLCPYKEQIRIVEKLDELFSELDAGINELKAAEQKLKLYRQSLLKSAVEGQLTKAWRNVNQHTIDETGQQLLARVLKERRKHWEAQKLAEFAEKGKKPPKNWQDKYPQPVKPNTKDLPTLPEGWVWASIAQLASDRPHSLAIGPFGSNLKVSDYKESGVPLVFVRNIRSGNYGVNHTKYISETKALELAAHSVSGGDVVVTKMGEPPGDADIYPVTQPDAVITADCIKISCQKKLISPIYLKMTINSWVGRRQILPITKGVAQKKVSLGRFSSLAIPLPSLDEQQELINLVTNEFDAIDRQTQAVRQSLNQSQAQRKNILKAAFSGKLVPQDPNDEPAAVLLEKIKKQREEQAAMLKQTTKAKRAVSGKKAASKKPTAKKTVQ